MHIYVIAPEVGGRHGPLVEQLRQLSRHSFSMVPARIMRELPADFDRRAARAINNRDLTPGEVGCARSHRDAYMEILRTGAAWGCVLEDDARIVDTTQFERLLDEIDRLSSPECGAVVSLYFESGVLKRWPTSSFTPCWSEPPFSVAAAVSSEAARRLAIVNARSTQVADWPLGSGAQFLIADRRFVVHGDELHSSIIGNARSGPALSRQLGRGNLGFRLVLNRLSLYSFAYYILNRRHFDGVRGYLATMLRPRVVWHLGRLLGRPSGLAPDVYVLSGRRRPQRTTSRSGI
jgi:GR25 family glycosyltransferase involved in LPS biosynthesis